MAFILPALNNPVVQREAMSILKDILTNLQINNNPAAHKKEIEDLKKQVNNLVSEKESNAAKLLEQKNKELLEVFNKNKQLSKEVSNLKREGALTKSLAKEGQDKEEKLALMEKEMEEIKKAKEKMEEEALRIQKECDEEKKNNKGLTDLVCLLSKMSTQDNSSPSTSSTSQLSLTEDDIIMIRQLTKMSTQDNSSTSTSSSTSQVSLTGDDILMKLKVLIENSIEPSDKPKKSKAKKTKAPSKAVEDASEKPSHDSGPAVNQNVTGPPPINYPYNMNYHSPNNAYMNMPSPHGPPNNFPLPYMQNPNSMGYCNQPMFNEQMNRPYLDKRPLLPTPMYPPSHNMNFMPPGNMPSTSSHTLGPEQGPFPYRPNIVNQPNNFNKNKNSKATTNETQTKKEGEETENQSKGSATGKNRNGEGSFDLWDQLDKLKDKMKEKNASKPDLMSNMLTLMSEASNSTTITSKEKFIEELSACAKPINDLPDRSSDQRSYNQNRPNFRNDFKKNQNREGTSQQYRNYMKNQNREGTSQQYRGRGGYHRGNQFKRYSQGESQFERGNVDTDSKSLKNEESDEGNLSDDVSSLCSEPPYQSMGNNRGYRGKFYGPIHYRRFHYINNNNQQNSDEVLEENDFDDNASLTSEKSFNSRWTNQDFIQILSFFNYSRIYLSLLLLLMMIIIIMMYK